MSVTAVTKKSTTAAVGEVWELAVKVSPVPEVDPNTGSPVRFEVTRPDGDGTSTVVATAGGGAPGVFTAYFVFDTDGEHTATAVVPSYDEDGGAMTRDGFTASVAPQSDEAANGLEDPTDDPDPAPGGTTDAA